MTFWNSRLKKVVNVRSMDLEGGWAYTPDHVADLGWVTNYMDLSDLQPLGSLPWERE